MKKSQFFPIAFMAGCFMSATSLFAQDQVVRMTTAKGVGESMTLIVNNTNAGVSVDWGDGVAVSYPKSEDAVCIIKGIVKGDNVVLTGGEKFNTLICENNKLTALDVSGAPDLQSLYCQQNQLTVLSIVKQTALKDLDVSDNKITNLQGTKNTNFASLENLNVANNGMTTMAGSRSVGSIGGANMQHLNIANNAFQTLYTSSNSNLDMLVCSNLGLKSKLQMSNNQKLSTLVCNGNNLTGIVISATGFPEMQQIICDDNQISSLDLSKSTKLSDISVANNGMTDLTYPSQKLQSMSCGGNGLTFRSLPIAKNMPAEGLFVYTPQANVDISDASVFVESEAYPGLFYVPQCPSYSDRTNSKYILDLTDYRYDGGGLAKVEMVPVSVVEGEDVTLTKATATDKEQDYTLTNGCKFTFLRMFEKISILMTHASYPDLVIRSNVFAVDEKGLTSIKDVMLSPGQEDGSVYDLQGRRVQNPRQGIFIKNGKKVYVK